MFTLKFYRENDTQGAVHRTVAVPKYEISYRPDFVQCFIWKQLDDDMYADVYILRNTDPSKPMSGETHQNLNDLASNGGFVYEALYVENAAGKTIDTVRFNKG